MWQNILVSSSMAYGLRALSIAPTPILFWTMSGSILSSVAYHLIEKHKHQMKGIGYFNDIVSHHVFLNIDRIFAIALGSQILFDYQRWYTDKYIIGCGLIGFTLMTLSEMVYKKNKFMYIITHCGWHLLAFHSVYLYCLKFKI